MALFAAGRFLFHFYTVSLSILDVETVVPHRDGYPNSNRAGRSNDEWIPVKMIETLRQYHTLPRILYRSAHRTAVYNSGHGDKQLSIAGQQLPGTRFI